LEEKDKQELWSLLNGNIEKDPIVAAAFKETFKTIDDALDMMILPIILWCN
jgi:hypothetical protein